MEVWKKRETTIKVVGKMTVTTVKAEGNSIE